MNDMRTVLRRYLADIAHRITIDPHAPFGIVLSLIDGRISRTVQDIPDAVGMYVFPQLRFVANVECIDIGKIKRPFRVMIRPLLQGASQLSVRARYQN